MMEIIDEDYIRARFELPHGPARLVAWITSLIEQRDTAEEISKCCVAQIKPLKARAQSLLEANNALVDGKRDLRFELQAEIDAAHAELDGHRAAAGPRAETIEAAKLLEWFADRHDLDLAYKYDLEPGWIPKHLMKPGPIPEEGWCVHQERGGRNDREWTMIALEATPLAALREAHKAFCDGQ
jgi:hypothetical protein